MHTPASYARTQCDDLSAESISKVPQEIKVGVYIVKINILHGKNRCVRMRARVSPQTSASVPETAKEKVI